MLTFVVFVAELFFLRDVFRRMSVLPCPHVLMLCVICSQAIMFLCASDLIDIGSIRSFTNYGFVTHYSEVLLLYFFLFMVLYTASVGYKFKVMWDFKWINIPNSICRPVVALFYVYALAHLFVLNHDILIQNNVYLILGSPEALTTQNSILRILFGSFIFVGVIVIIFMMIMLRTRHYGLFIAILPLAVWWFLFELAGHSRAAASYVMIVAGFLATSRSRGAVLLSCLLFLFGVASLYAALGGRNSGIHGLVSLQYYFDNIQSAFEESSRWEPILNIFGGIIYASELFVWSVDHSPVYKWLSLSPLPSVLDNFGEVRELSEIRINEFMPMGALHELYSFGSLFIILYLIVVFFALRLSIRSVAKYNGFLPIFGNTIASLAWYLQDIYAVRNVFRLFYISILISVAAHFLRPHSNAKKSGATSRFSL